MSTSYFSLASGPADLPAPTIGDVGAHPDYWITGAGSAVADLTECPHGYRLTDSCPVCADDDTARKLTTIVTLADARVMSTQRPWGEALVGSGKPVENRTWTTRWRGPVVIHSGQKWDDRGRDIPSEMGVPPIPRDTPTGYVGLMELVGVHRDKGCCRPWGEPESYHWELAFPRRFDVPLAGPGTLGLYKKVPLAVAHTIATKSWTIRIPGHPGESNFCVELLCDDGGHSEVVVHARNPREAAQRAMSTDPRYLVGRNRCHGAPVEVTSMRRLALRGPR